MQVVITPKAEKQYKQLPKPERSKIKRKLLALEIDPLIGKKLAGQLATLRSLRAWPDRIIYYINEPEQMVYITSILHRQGAYK